MIVLLMGVSGAGKTAVGTRLAARLDWDFIDGDDLHGQANIDKMAAGVALDDRDREPWLRKIRSHIDRYETTGRSAIIACSALRQSYREILLAGTATSRLVYLEGDRSLIAGRLEQRADHFFDPRLLASQFDTLEEPDNCLRVPVDTDLDSVVRAVIGGLELDRRASQEKRQQ